MKIFKKVVLALMVLAITASLAVSVFAAASTAYANCFVSKKLGANYECYYKFIPDHVATANEPFCKEGKQIKQAWVRAYRNKGAWWSGYSTDTYYSKVATDSNCSKTYYTPTAKIEDKWYAKEYTKYNYSTFN